MQLKPIAAAPFHSLALPTVFSTQYDFCPSKSRKRWKASHLQSCASKTGPSRAPIMFPRGGTLTTMSARFPGASSPVTSDTPRSFAGALLHRLAICDAVMPRAFMPFQVPGSAYCRPAAVVASAQRVTQILTRPIAVRHMCAGKLLLIMEAKISWHHTRSSRVSLVHTCYPSPRTEEVSFLEFLQRWWSGAVVRGDYVEGASNNASPQLFPVLCAANWRSALVPGVPVGDFFSRKVQIMNTGLDSDWNS